MKRLTLLFSLLLLLAAQRPLPPDDLPIPTHHTYLPIIYGPPLPLVPDTRPGPEPCLSWTPGWSVKRGQETFGAHHFYHSGSHAQPWLERGGLPIWRASKGRPENFLTVGTAVLENKPRIILLHNEPDIAGQDGLSPADAAALYRLAINIYPNAAYVTPNANSLDYLDAFLREVGDDWRPKDRVGIHIYQPPTTFYPYIDADYPSIWPRSWIAAATATARNHGIKTAVWVTEVGPNNNWTQADLNRYHRELFTSQAQVVCIYTTHCGGYSNHACRRNLFTSRTNPTLTPSGLAFLYAVSDDN